MWSSCHHPQIGDRDAAQPFGAFPKGHAQGSESKSRTSESESAELFRQNRKPLANRNPHQRAVTIIPKSTWRPTAGPTPSASLPGRRTRVRGAKVKQRANGGFLSLPGTSPRASNQRRLTQATIEPRAKAGLDGGLCGSDQNGMMTGGLYGFGSGRESSIASTRSEYSPVH